MPLIEVVRSEKILSIQTFDILPTYLFKISKRDMVLDGLQRWHGGTQLERQKRGKEKRGKSKQIERNYTGCSSSYATGGQYQASKFTLSGLLSWHPI